MEAIFALVAVVAFAMPPVLMLIPQPPTQLTSPVNMRSAEGLTPLVSNAVVPVMVLNSYLATRLASERLPPEATVPSCNFRPFENNSEASIGVTGMPFTNTKNNTNKTTAQPTQTTRPKTNQQKRNTTRSRTT